MNNRSNRLWHHACVIRAVTLLLAAALLLAAPAVGVPASIRILTGDPVKVAGQGFPAQVQVRVTLFSGITKKTLTVRTSRTGRFAVTFNVVGDRCSGYAVTATGGGTKAAAKVPPHECAQPLTAP